MINYATMTLCGTLTGKKLLDGENGTYNICIKSKGHKDYFYFRCATKDIEPHIAAGCNQFVVTGTPRWDKGEIGKIQLTVTNCTVQPLEVEHAGTTANS